MNVIAFVDHLKVWIKALQFGCVSRHAHPRWGDTIAGLSGEVIATGAAANRAVAFGRPLGRGDPFPR